MRIKFLAILVFALLIYFSGCYTNPQDQAPDANNNTPQKSSLPQEKPSEPSELVLVIGSAPKDAQLISDIENADGTYKQELLTEDGLISIITQSLPAKPEADILARIHELYPDSRDVMIQDNDMSVAHCPTERASFITGYHEDTRTNEVVLIKTDQYDFMFIASIPIDSYDEYADLIEVWIKSLDIFDPQAQS